MEELSDADWWLPDLECDSQTLEAESSTNEEKEKNWAIIPLETAEEEKEETNNDQQQQQHMKGIDFDSLYMAGTRSYTEGALVQKPEPGLYTPSHVSTWYERLPASIYEGHTIPGGYQCKMRVHRMPPSLLDAIEEEKKREERANEFLIDFCKGLTELGERIDVPVFAQQVQPPEVQPEQPAPIIELVVLQHEQPCTVQKKKKKNKKRTKQRQARNIQNRTGKTHAHTRNYRSMF